MKIDFDPQYTILSGSETAAAKECVCEQRDHDDDNSSRQGRDKFIHYLSKTSG